MAMQLSYSVQSLQDCNTHCHLRYGCVVN